MGNGASSSLRLFLLFTLICAAAPVMAQRPLCNQLPAAERARARSSGLCREPAPIIDVAPRGQAEPPAAAATSPVPSVVGLSFDEARTRLTRFTVQRSYRAAAEPGGTVLAQSPMAPATLPADAPISLVLSDGSLVRVPRVTNTNINEARQRLQKDLDLKAQPEVVTSDLRVGTVIEQQPGEGTLVKRGSVVRLQVSAGQEGPELIDVPNVVGMPFDRAQARLVRFTVERAERPHTAPVGQVIEQTPRAATRATARSVVVLTVSSAPRAAIEIFEMPNVVGRTYTDAARALAEFKVSRTEMDNAAPRDQIVAQTPAAGSTLMPGDVVALQVSAGSPVAAAGTGVVAASSSAPGAPAAATKATTATSSGGRNVLAVVLAIAAAVLLGLIAGGLLMRQWLFRRQAAAEDAMTSLPSLPQDGNTAGITAVDILLDDQAAAERKPDAAQNEDSRSEDDQEKNSGRSPGS